MDRLYKSLSKNAKSILKTKKASGKEKLDDLKVEISNARTDTEQNVT